MDEKDKSQSRGRDIVSHANRDNDALTPSNSDSADAITILDERIHNLREAIEEIDAALAHRKVLNVRFLEQIDRESEEVKRHLNQLNDPWKTGFYPELEFLRLSFHKSLTSRAKEQRTEQLKYWENGVNLAEKRRKFLDEYKELLAARKRLVQS
jgi:hypothetical protein